MGTGRTDICVLKMMMTTRINCSDVCEMSCQRYLADVIAQGASDQTSGQRLTTSDVEPSVARLYVSTRCFSNSCSWTLIFLFHFQFALHK